MTKSGVQRAIKFSIDRLGYESLKPELETVLRWQECFCSFAYGLRQIVVLHLFSTHF